MARKPKTLTCLYSGLGQQIMFAPGPDQYGWSLVGGFDPALPFLSYEDGEAAFRRRNGNENAVERASCPYTGKPVDFNFVNGLWWPKGDIFQPYASWMNKEELIYRASFRAGRTNRRKPDPAPIVRGVEERIENSDPCEGMDGGKCIQPLIEELLEQS